MNNLDFLNYELVSSSFAEKSCEESDFKNVVMSLFGKFAELKIK